MHVTGSKYFHGLSVSGLEQVVVDGVITISEKHLTVIATPVVKRIPSANSQNFP
jgi:hypothetical protein